MTKLQTCYPRSASSKLGIDRDSHMISKFKPKIRIIHIYAPEIIKTDAANFRELVQRLTGKPENEGGCGSKSKAAPVKDSMDLYPNKAMIMSEDEGEFPNLKNEIRVKNQQQKENFEDDIWKRSKSNEKFSGFIEGFSELDGLLYGRVKY
ncbi:hypothetical protein TanjilG_20209 [Lupinus angustifolius]|uniref:VQ domain-containing protein n=1 Tax=Lupinus angustifolius TaxID=3871 RepID=A0A1J7IC42_LUPAN|nr:PREDICTED: VQ motif-containing protein 25-like [Lupinus angustifolius]OIW11725.1 hypothetical protein TanjilG_20209 [Lupinus angustifolius]